MSARWQSFGFCPKEEYMIDTNVKPFIIESTQFKTFFVELWFPYERTQNIIAEALLPSLLVHTSKKYPDEPSFSRALLEKNILDITCGLRRIGTNTFFKCTLTMPDETVVSRREIEEGISFFLDTIYDPNLLEDHFDEEAFERAKKRMIVDIENDLKTIDTMAYLHIIDRVDTSGILKSCTLNHLEDAKKITGKEVYFFYQNAIQKVKPFVFAIGNFETRKLESFIKKELQKRKLETVHYTKNYTCFLEPIGTFKEIKEKGAFNQSYLSFVYKIKDMKEEDRLILQAITGLLSSQSSDLLLKMLRDQKDLVYEASAALYGRFGMIMLEAKMYRESYEEAKEQIYKTVELLKDREVVEPLLQNLKDRKRLNLKRNLDSKYAILGEKVDECLGFDVSLEDEYQRFCSIAFEDITSLVDRFELELIYFMEGVGNHETEETQ